MEIPTLKIKTSEKVFIHGPSGSGKSTLLNLLSGVLKPTKGEIHILGENIAPLSVRQKDKFRGDHIGFIFQSFNLIPYLSVKENIILPYLASKLRRKRLQSSIDQEVNQLAGHLNLTDYLEKKASQLSVGQQQRVAVARALIGSPDIILADEPTSSLDDSVTEKFMNLLLEEQKAKKFTLVFVSHDKRLSKHFDREISLSNINKTGILQ